MTIRARQRPRPWHLTVVVGVFVATSVLLASSRAEAASLTGPVNGWSKGDVPSTDSMYEYVPSKPAANPPILVISHNCGGSAASMFAWAPGIVSAADQYGFILVYPQTSNNCWDVSSKATQTRNGGGDSQAITEMVDYAVSEHTANAARVYAAGTSSGAMMTELLLAVYPDKFKGGSEFSGVPAGCSNVFDGTGLCGLPEQTPAQWGDRVRAMDPGYSGYRPRIQLWHGTGDMTINYQNQLEAIKEWTNVLGLSQTPTTPSTTLTVLGHSWDHESWEDACGRTLLDVWTEPGGPHNTDANLDATYVIPFLALESAAPTDPDVAACEDGGSGASGSSSGGSGSSGATAVDSGTSGATAVDSGSSGTSGASSGSSHPGGGSDAGSGFASGSSGASSGSAGLTGSATGASNDSGSSMGAGSGSQTSGSVAATGSKSDAGGSGGAGSGASGSTAAAASGSGAQVSSSNAGGCSLGPSTEPTAASGAALTALVAVVLASSRRRRAHLAPARKRRSNRNG